MDADLPTDTQGCLLEEIALVQPVFRSLCKRLIREKIFNYFSLDRRVLLSHFKDYHVIRRVPGGCWVCLAHVFPMRRPWSRNGNAPLVLQIGGLLVIRWATSTLVCS